MVPAGGVARPVTTASDRRTSTPTVEGKVYPSPAAALHDVPDGATIMFGGFVSAGKPDNLILALIELGVTGITAIANNIGNGDHLDDLCEKRQIARAITSFAIRASASRGSRFEEQYRVGEVQLELVPQGTLAERIRAGGAGIGGFYTPAAAGTALAEGKESRVIDGREHVLEYPLRADFALLKATRADTAGNLSYRKVAKNFNMAMATAAEIVIAEVEEIVAVGEIDPELVDTPGVYVDRIVLGERRAPEWHT
ncbi:MAG: 3-oxoacid CoA-transferase subunit A [Dehalococcoidia bacterium]|nr:3-oxoacid CoA-transferase subunit A [Dehalococcoidia bacterium]